MLTGIQPFAAQERIRTRYQFAFEGSGAEHFAIENGVRHVIVSVGRIWVFGNFGAKLGQRFGEFEVVKVLVSRLRLLIFDECGLPHRQHW